MNAKIIASFGMILIFASLGNSVYAQSSESNSNPVQYKTTGNALNGIESKTTQDDFLIFFEPNNLGSNSINNRRNNTTPVKLRVNDSQPLPDSSVFLVPVEAGNDNQGMRLQLDLDNE
ncbi:hypothetical protein FNW02_21380 [Komarekiella sp. 'clone 1']|uniref:Uncharacterized protein n=1 Tax=Komarekiella delphini-convector SJRDD-AB1 TaxID=2593771 RepID=A0AA40T075_9NOST|nr:hypothetical protein [Komarekiella delphini-convector]MBD6618305.1 hypothetical protein [Komarekiella delphini-convector SJRDD-AB1]